MRLTKSGKARTNYALNKKYALNNEQHLTTNFYGIIVIISLFLGEKDCTDTWYNMDILGYNNNM